MIWTNKGLRERVAELESLLSSANEKVSELNSDKEFLVNLCNSQHATLVDLRSKLVIADILKTSPIVDELRPKEEKPSRSLGRNIGRALRGKKE